MKMSCTATSSIMQRLSVVVRPPLSAICCCMTTTFSNLLMYDHQQCEMLQVTNKQQVRLPPAPAYNFLTQATAKPGKPLTQSSGQKAVLRQQPVRGRSQSAMTARPIRQQGAATVHRDSQLPPDHVICSAAQGDVAKLQHHDSLAVPGAMQVGPKLSFKRIRRAK